MLDNGENNACLINIECDSITDEPFMYDLSPISVIYWDEANDIDLQFGTTENNRYNNNNLWLRLSSAVINDAIGGTYDANNEHEFEIRAHAESATHGTWSFYLDGTLLVSGLPYVFDDAVKRLNWQPHPSISNEYNFDDLEISTIISPADESEYVFFDDFNAANYLDANWGYATRQTNSTLIVPYGAVPQFFSITNSKLHAYTAGAELRQDGEMARHIVGEDFELACKVTVPDTTDQWSSIYMYDETGDPRGESRLGCLIWGQAHGVAFSLYSGTGVNQDPGIDVTVAQLVAELGSYDKSAEHTLQFVSTAGVGETNTYDFVVDGVTMVSNIVYRFDGAVRSLGIIGITPTDLAGGVFYDDIYLKAFPKATYEAWAADNGLAGADALRTADIENGGLGDGMENLLEYVLGGDPNADDAASILPVLQFPDATTMEYIYRRRNDAAARGLTYDLNVKGDLVLDPWTSTGGAYETGTNAISAEINVITNSADITGVPGLFLNLEVTED